MKFGIRKLESWATGRWRNHYASFLFFDTIPARDGQTDRQTEGRRDGRTRCCRNDPH